MDKTIEYYNKNAKEYVNKTIELDMKSVYEHFTKHLGINAQICDLGCGSGRDSKYFISQGFFVTPIDGSVELCKLASIHLGQDVMCLKFDELNFVNKFDAIWACSSLLHVPKIELGNIINRLVLASKENAVIYACFKYGNSEKILNGCLFSDYNQEELLSIVSKFKSLKLIEIWLSDDVRNSKNTQWINIIVSVDKW